MGAEQDIANLMLAGETGAADVMRDLIAETTKLIPWRSMDSAPFDGSEFIWMSVITWCGGEKRKCDLEFQLYILHRERNGSSPEKTRGYWSTASHSVDDASASRGYWMPRSEFREWLIERPFWNSAPRDRPCVFVRSEYESYVAKSAWFEAAGWRTTHGPMADAYLDGAGRQAILFRWCELEAFVPHRVSAD